MAILVTGGGGYIGSHVVWALLDAGEKPVVLDRFSTGFRWAVPMETKIYEGDIADRRLLRTVFRDNNIEAVMHFAGSVVVPDSVLAPLEYYENNTVKSRELIAAAIEAKVPHFVFSSTAAVYGTPISGDLVSESSPTSPESPYGMSKLMTEIMLRDAAAAHNFSYTALRYFNVAGADPLQRTGQSTIGATHLIKVACETARGGRAAISVFGTDYPTPDGTCIRDYIHVSDLANAHLKALYRMRAGAGSIVANCGYGHGFSVLEVLAAVKKVTGIEFQVNRADRRVGDAVSVVSDPSLAKTELGWEPMFDDLETIVKSAFTWETHLSRKNSAEGSG